MQHCVCCGRKKLPFAEYSVVKDQLGGVAPETPRLGRSREPLRPAPLPRMAILGREESLRDQIR